MNLSEILKACAALSSDDRRTLNKQLVSLIKQDVNAKAAVAGAKFSIGDKVMFFSKKRQMFVTITITGIGPKNIKGTEAGQSLRFWTVYAPMCKKVDSSAPAVKPAAQSAAKTPAYMPAGLTPGQKAAWTKKMKSAGIPIGINVKGFKPGSESYLSQ